MKNCGDFVESTLIDGHVGSAKSGDTSDNNKTATRSLFKARDGFQDTILFDDNECFGLVDVFVNILEDILNVSV